MVKQVLLICLVIMLMLLAIQCLVPSLWVTTRLLVLVHQLTLLMLQPVLRIAGDLAPAVEIVTDFKERAPTAVPTTITTTGGKWDTGLWDVALWSPSTETRDSWTSVTGIGYCGAVRLRVLPPPLIYTDLGVDDVDLVSYGDGIVALSYTRNTNAPCEIIAFNVKYQNQTGGQL